MAMLVLTWLHQIIPSLQSGAIDASEFVGPWIDMALGLHKAAKYYYYPGFHEPGAASNRDLWISHIRLSDKTSRLHPRHVRWTIDPFAQTQSPLAQKISQRTSSRHL